MIDTIKIFDKVSSMKKLSAFAVIIMLLASSLASAAHACCADETSSDNSHMSQSINDSDSQDDNVELACDCAGCGCSHHGHSKIPLAQMSLDNLSIVSAVMHNWDGDIYHSQLYDPISKPPKA